MPTLLSEDEFLVWEVETMREYPDRAMYYDPNLNRVFLLYYNDNKELAKYYALSEGEDFNGTEIIFKYSKEEKGMFQDIDTVDEFQERANIIYDTDTPRMN